MADSDIIVSLHLVIPFISMGDTNKIIFICVLLTMVAKASKSGKIMPR